MLNSLYSYKNFRKYLQDYYVFQKENRPEGYTYLTFSKAAGLKSGNYLKLVIDGSRGLSVENIHQFAKALQLNFDETQYFEALVFFNQSEANTQSVYYKSRLETLTKAQVSPFRVKDREQMFSDWFTPAVLVSVDGETPETGAEGVSLKTGVDLARVIETIEKLISYGLIDLVDGKYKITGKQFEYRDAKSSNLSHQRFQAQHLALAQKVLEKRYNRQAKFMAHTFTISEGSFDAYVAHARAFLQNLAEISNSDTPDKVVQLNIQLFQLTTD